jgi:soluble lytic murein transglycosylase
MPRVPTLNGPSVAPSLGPQNNFRPTLSPEAASLPGRQLQQQGQAMERAASNTGDMFLQVAEQANRVRAIEATNRAKEAAQRLTFDQKQGFSNLKGSAAVYRESGKALPDEFGGMLDEEIAKIGEGLTNPQQRELFAEASANLSMTFRENAQRHFLSEFNTYQKSVHEGRIGVASQTIALNAGDSKQVDEAIKDIKASTFELGKQAGLSAEQVEIATLNATSAAHRDALMKALDEDQTGFAQKYFDKYKDQITADDQRDLEKVLTEQNDLGLAYAAVDAAAGQIVEAAAATLMPEQAGKKWTAAEMAAAVPTLFGKGYTVTSGYRGPDHHLTKANPGSAHARNRAIDIAAPSVQVGRDPAAFNRAVEKFRSLGLNVKAINEYVSPSKHATGGHWHFEINDAPGAGPARTRKGATAMPQQEFIERALTAAGPDITPKQRQLIEQQASVRWAREKQALDQVEDEATLAAMQSLAANGGDLSLVPPSVLARVPANKLDSVTSYGLSLQNNVRAANPNLPVLYYDLISNPTKLRDMSDSQFFALSGQMPQSDFRTLTNQRAELRNPSDSVQGKANVIDMAAVSRTLNPQLEIMGISSSPAAKDKEGKARVGAIQLVVDRAILQRQAELKPPRQLFDNEISDLIDGLLARTYTTDETNFFGQRTGKKLTKPVVQVTVQDIPPTRLKRIEDNLKRRTGQKPSPEEITYQFLLEEINLLPTR